MLRSLLKTFFEYDELVLGFVTVANIFNDRIELIRIDHSKQKIGRTVSFTDLD
jgi:hypothetical protein